ARPRTSVSSAMSPCSSPTACAGSRAIPKHAGCWWRKARACRPASTERARATWVWPTGAAGGCWMRRPPVAAAESAAAPWLGLLVAAHNATRYIETCLHSLLEQAAGDPGIEVLVLDDASSDDTGTILARLAAVHPGQLRVLRA